MATFEGLLGWHLKFQTRVQGSGGFYGGPWYLRMATFGIYTACYLGGVDPHRIMGFSKAWVTKGVPDIIAIFKAKKDTMMSIRFRVNKPYFFIKKLSSTTISKPSTLLGDLGANVIQLQLQE